MNQKRKRMEFVGRWHIYEMEMWDEDYFNEEDQAYVTISKSDMGDFQFGYVSGSIDGKVVRYPGSPDVSRFEFSWNGVDENDPANGCGWIKQVSKDTIEGEFRIHCGDDSMFLARRAV